LKADTPPTSKGSPIGVTGMWAAAVNRGPVWRLIWRGAEASIVVRRSTFRPRASILADGVVVAQMAKPTLARPWVECQVPHSEPPIVVVLAMPRPYWYITLVFQGGVSVDDGSSLDYWRSNQPAPTDRFEQGFRGPLWGPLGALLLGGLCASVQLAAYGKASGDFWALGAAAAFLTGAGWMWATILLVRWLRAKRTWPWRLRRLIVVVATLGVPVLVVLAVQTAMSGR